MVETLQKSIQESTGIEETAKAEQEEFTAGYTWKPHLYRDGVVVVSMLSAGNCGNAPEGRALLRHLGPTTHPAYLLIDHEEDEAWALSTEYSYIPIVPPKAIVKIFGIMISISNYTSNVIKLRGFFAVSRILPHFHSL